MALLAAGGGTLDMAANIFYLIAVRQGPMSVVVTLASLYPRARVPLARIVLGERRLVQVAGVACALAAVPLIVSGALGDRRRERPCPRTVGSRPTHAPKARHPILPSRERRGLKP